ncbi:MAG: sigma 54-interacting transcriptional regulator [Anaerovorax sp.]
MKNDLTIEDYKYYLEHIFGFVVIDLTGKVTYINKQVCDFCHLDYDTAIGKHIEELFPFSKMMDTIRFNQPATMSFYFYEGRASASMRTPLFKDDKLIGVLEYDLFQDMGLIEQFVNHYIDLDDELKYYKEEVKKYATTRYTVDSLIGHSDTMLELKEQIKYVARTNSTVLISGETGTGKELVAQAIHNLSKRRLKNFIKINAAGLPESLAESELFGYDAGSFTGAKSEGKKGKFEIANHGTLFIDEINQMPLTLQPKLLRVLQEKEVDRIGSEKPTPLDVRIIAASNKDLEKLVKEGEFREDLYYRLDVVEVNVPPLRDHLEDIPLLVNHFVENLNNLLGKTVQTIEDGVYVQLKEHHWPGNVRELQNVIEKTMNYVEGTVLREEDLNFNHVGKNLEINFLENTEKPIEDFLERAERSLIVKTLKKFDGNKTKAAEFLKIRRTLLYQKMKRLNIDK